MSQVCWYRAGNFIRIAGHVQRSDWHASCRCMKVYKWADKKSAIKKTSVRFRFAQLVSRVKYFMLY